MADNNLNIEPPPQQVPEFNFIWKNWLYSVYKRLKYGPLLIAGYAKANLPSAADYGNGSDMSALVFVNDEIGGATLAFSDGTNWRRVQDRAIVS